MYPRIFHEQICWKAKCIIASTFSMKYKQTFLLFFKELDKFMLEKMKVCIWQK